MGDSTGIVDDKKGIQLANLALAERYITAEQWTEALAIQSREFTESRPVRSLIDILEDRGFLRQDQIDDLKGKMAALSEPRSGAPRSFEPEEAGKFGKYVVVRKIGVGPQGKVYEAHDPEGRKRRALKIVRRSPGSDPSEIAREQECFQREGRKIAAIPDHPHVVRVTETGVVRGKRYVVSELVQGRTWKEWSRRDKNLLQMLIVLRDAARALHHLHQHGVIHGRLKPENLIVDENDQPRITDAGLGRAVRHDPRAMVTASVLSVETAGYLSPEQGQGNAAVDARADVYALGALLYEILAGEPPFRAETPIQTLLRASNEKPVRPSALARERGFGGVDPDLERIALRAMARYPDDRHASAEAFAEELSGWIGGRRGGFLARHATLLIAAGIAAAALSGLAAYFLLG